MNITMAMLPSLPAEPRTVSLDSIEFAGSMQAALGYLFLGVLNGEQPHIVPPEPTIGGPDIGPGHILDSLAHDYALLPDDLTCATSAMNVCCVRQDLPACEGCGGPGRYDIWPNAYQSPAMLCETCAQPHNGVELGTGSATYVLTLDEMPLDIRGICDKITTELGRPSLWSQS